MPDHCTSQILGKHKLFSMPQVQIEQWLFDKLIAFGFTRSILNQWHPPYNSPRRMLERHVDVLIFLREQGVSTQQSIVEINSLNTYEAWGLRLLYSSGLRGENIRELKNHFRTLYPEADFYEQIVNALQDLIELEKLTVSDAIEEIKKMDVEQMISCFSID
ncbi:hypothetical protein [Legionella genomosp. 1]|uniref:hypothetical protein n=1 Tax=Legionella genomosp. 1 TaxID=1093625 RepID=UPI001055A623|nr:hypothetical protein [Legionella genomosp. 1]